MIDPSRLVEFKKTTNEDLLVAGLIMSLCDLSKVSNILDIGAGTGLVSAAIKKDIGNVEVTVVDESQLYVYPSDFSVIIDKWENVDIAGPFDLIIMSHVLGDFDPLMRPELLAKATNLLSNNGTIISVENGPDKEFDRLVSEIFDRQGTEFDIDESEVLEAFKREELVTKTWPIKSFLPIGRDLDEAKYNANLFFPKEFDGTEDAIAEKLVERLRFGDRYVIPVLQNIIVGTRPSFLKV